MSDATEPKLEPAKDEIPSNDPKPVEDESKLATNTGSAQTAPPTFTEQATSVASTAAGTVVAAASGVTDNVFSMFGGGDKKGKKNEEDEDRGDNSGSAKAQKEAAAAENPEDEVPESEDREFKPVVHLKPVDTKSGNEDEEEIFNMRAKLFKFTRESNEWKERGTGNVRLWKHQKNQMTRLVMRRDKTLKVCANHYVTPDMKLAPNVGSDRSWVWNASHDISEGEPEAQTLAIRFANSENANLFKDAFLKAQKENEALLKTDQGSTSTEA